jgi:hypothetical protein
LRASISFLTVVDQYWSKRLIVDVAVLPKKFAGATLAADVRFTFDNADAR